eukprot:Nk52_evm5s2579 gene=Nk52_evmTU5s2579
MLWHRKKFSPLDQRFECPHIPKKPLRIPEVVPDNWIPRTDPELYYTLSLPAIPDEGYLAQRSTRCEEWSVLKQMLPSKPTVKKNPEADHGWGVKAFPPVVLNRPGEERTNYNLIGNPATKYYDSMIKADKQFYLF